VFEKDRETNRERIQVIRRRHDLERERERERERET